AIGTVHYISPEQARGDETDEKSDIYSVGVMLYEMLTGQKPFDTDNPISIAVMHMQNTPQRPRSINPDIPAGLEEIILRAMEKDPENRYQTAADMIRDIEAFKANNSMTFGYYSNSGKKVVTEKKADTDSPTQYFNSAAAQQEAENVRRKQQVRTRPKYEPEEEYYDEDDGYDYEGDDEDEDEEEEARPSVFIPVMTAITIAFIIVAVLFVLWLVKGVLNDPGRSTKYEMPNLVGMDYYEAKDTYSYLDLQIDKTEYSNYEKDVIFFQDVQVGEAVGNGQTVKVNVSLGISMAKVPDVSNYHYEYARKILEQEGFITELKYEMSSDGTQASNVIRTEPSAGQEAEAGSTIIIYVSKGMNSDAIEVSNMVGMTLEQATTLCEYYGLVVEKVDEASLEAENTVIAQSIEAGEFVESGDTITLTYSNGEDPSGIVTYTLPIPEGVQGVFTIDIIDNTGVSRTSKRIVAGISTSVSIDVQGTGSETLSVVITSSDGKTATIGTYNFDFANIAFTPVKEDINAAFDAIGATQPPTEAPAPADGGGSSGGEVTPIEIAPAGGSSSNDNSNSGGEEVLPDPPAPIF
ncbi:MAG: PASTA domain-containing protein, partial [Oscillospiraceae bacterium]|nr:PASTA domain-containing protein [Oscillospiraceae bacterium]